MSNKSFKKQAIDQILHAGWAILKMLAFVLPMGVILAGALTMVEAVVRELEQHKWDITDLGWLDLSFWFAGIVLFVAGYYTFLHFWQ